MFVKLNIGFIIQIENISILMVEYFYNSVTSFLWLAKFWPYRRHGLAHETLLSKRQKLKSHLKFHAYQY